MSLHSHNDLASSLAADLRLPRWRSRVTWENIELRKEEGIGIGCRPDVFSIYPTLRVEKCRPWTCEVKVSRGDFLSDVRSGKWRNYLKFSSRVYFAAPLGMIKKDEVPNEAGLIVFGPRHEGHPPSWFVEREAKHNKDWQLHSRDLMKLILGRWGTLQAVAPPLAPSSLRATLAQHGVK